MYIEQSDFHDFLMRGLAHRMNNILSLFHGYLAILFDGKTLDAQTVDGLEAIRSGANSASELMDRARAFARPTSTVWREIEVGRFIRALLPAVESSMGSVRIDVDCAENLPPVWCEAGSLKTALLELIRNALEASPPGGAVEISAQMTTSDAAKAGNAGQAKWVAIAVTDNGAGIAPDCVEKVFQPFFTTKHERNAMGLGLSVALGLAKQLDGVLRMESAPGRTTFRLLLPARSESKT